MFRFAAAGLGVALLLATSPVLATEIPKEQLDADYKQCIESKSDPKYTDKQWAAFCQCNVDGEKAQFSYEEYKKLAEDIQSSSLANPDSLNKFKSIAQGCNAKTLQQP